MRKFKIAFEVFDVTDGSPGICIQEKSQVVAEFDNEDITARAAANAAKLEGASDADREMAAWTRKSIDIARIVETATYVVMRSIRSTVQDALK